MSKAVQQIITPIKDEMNLFEKRFYESMKSKIPLLDRITQFIIRRKGKQMRPMFVFLSAKLTGKVSDKTYRAASLIELIHTATLIHDDVVDESYMRRSFFSINALWKNKIAVLVGDYLLSKSVLLATDNQDIDLLSVVSKIIRDMSEGELLQLEKSRKLDINEEVYFEIIKQKTAILISGCCQAGALSAFASDEVVEKMRLFGEYTGIAFQIKDDLFDYTNTNLIGKPIGIDIQERKITLPLIYILNKVDKNKKKWIINSLKNYNKDKKRVRELLNFVKENGGLEYTHKVMNHYKEKAMDILRTFPENQYRDSLEKMLDYVINREN